MAGVTVNTWIALMMVGIFVLGWIFGGKAKMNMCRKFWTNAQWCPVCRRFSQEQEVKLMHMVVENPDIDDTEAQNRLYPHGIWSAMRNSSHRGKSRDE